MRAQPSFLMAAALLSLTLSANALAACSSRPFTSSEQNVLRAYIAYYSRPADSGGLAYWANRMDGEDSSVNSIIQAFGVSQKFTDRYGTLSTTNLVTGIYRQLFGRDPEQAGLDYYVGELEGGRRTLQTIALDVLFGAQNEDAVIVVNRLLASTYV
jgi:hypothetical protein